MCIPKPYAFIPALIIAKTRICVVESAISVIYSSCSNVSENKKNKSLLSKQAEYLSGINVTEVRGCDELVELF